jgi:hypothetical protein
VFVFVGADGHAVAVVEGSRAGTSGGAWDLMCDGRAEERRWRDQGITCVHVPFAEYEARHYECMAQKCSRHRHEVSHG